MELRALKNHVLGNSVRLGIMIFLLSRRRTLFRELQEVLELTPGNLDSHLRVLEKAQYVRIRKIFAERPRTAVEITDKGVEETGKYLEMLKEVLNQFNQNSDIREPSRQSLPRESP